LSGGENDISQVATDKQRALDKLVQAAQWLDEFLERRGSSADAAGLARFIEQTPDAGKLSDLLNRISDELRVCTELNQTNGAVLESNRAASERALRVLLSPNSDPDRYRASGRIESIGSGQSIGRA
jgi:flagellar biosynthesis/type III secretory pathway chaperone